MTIEKIVFIFAGFMIMLSIILAHLYSSYFLFITFFVGFMLFQSAFTKLCPLVFILKKLNLKSDKLF